MLGLFAGTAVASGDGAGSHWSYRIPAAKAGAVLSAGLVDTMVSGRLRGEGLEPAPRADRATLCRRLHLVLTGLPPTEEELERFVGDRSGDPVGRRVDELLASPRFGEHWARHWLDVVRYADSVTLRGFVFREAWRYRDYVVGAFNEDLPFDRFVREQVAGDLIEGGGLADRRRRLVATTFWALGDTNLEEQDKRQLELDVIDEQLDVLGKAFLAQTISCARCHDHKFDPIPTREYHALAGILSGTRLLKHANVSEWVESPLPGEPAEEAAWAAAEAEVTRLEGRLKVARERAKGAGGDASSKSLPGIVVDDSQARLVGEWTASTHNKPFVGQGYRHDGASGKGAKTATFQPAIPRSGEYEIRLAYTAGDNRATNVPVTLFTADGERTVVVDQRRAPELDGRFVSLGRSRFEQDGAGFVLVGTEGTTGHVIIDAVQFIPVDAGGTVAGAATGPAERGARAEAGPAEEVRALETALASAKLAARRPHYMAPVEVGATNLPVLRRGNWRNAGESVPRGMLRTAFGSEVSAPSGGASGRRELAEWLVHRGNPLTARVFVNRAWHWVFGAGLVRSVDNFGTTGDRPTHPELLDALSDRFAADGWSVKRLVRALVTSEAFLRSSDPRDPRVAASVAADPGNRWLARFAARRAEAEVLRDAMLMTAGGLRLDGAGEAPFPATVSADYGFAAFADRRSVYLPVFRNARPVGLTVFDAADPSRVTGARDVSTVAPQALYLLNDAFVRRQAERAAASVASEGDPVAALWRRALSRPPTAGERAAVEEHLRAASDRVEGLADVAQAVLGSVDFRNVP